MKMFIYPQFHLFQKLLQSVLTFVSKYAFIPMSSIKARRGFETSFRIYHNEFYQTIRRFKANSRVIVPISIHKN
jgi:hypothetical protein